MFRRRFQKCYCMNNGNNNMNSNMIEDKCDNVCPSSYEEINTDECSNVTSYESYDDSCGCGFDEGYNVFPENPMLAQSYVPIQYMDKTFKPCIGLKMGTIFPELVSPYMPCQSMRVNEFLEATNTVGEGCNK